MNRNSFVSVIYCVLILLLLPFQHLSLAFDNPKVPPVKDEKWGTLGKPKLVELQKGTFKLEKIFAPDLGTAWLDMILNGYSTQLEDTAHKSVKTLPALISEKPLHGSIGFDYNYYTREKGPLYCFVFDESAGTGTGYDTFIFDINHDFDLTNDTALKPAEEPPLPHYLTSGENVYFQQFDLQTQADSETISVQIIPRLRISDNRFEVYFTAPDVFRGKVKLGSKKYSVILHQGGAITGRFDSPTTHILIDELNYNAPLVNALIIGKKYYHLQLSPKGETITVKPYKGKFGLFSSTCTTKDNIKGKIEFAQLLGDIGLVDIKKCKGNDNGFLFPVGEYYPFYLEIPFSNIKAIFSRSVQDENQKSAKIHLNHKEPFQLQIRGKPEIIFSSPEQIRKYKPSDELLVKALFDIPEMQLKLRHLQDLTKPIETFKVPPDGDDYKIYKQISPVVKITNSSGKVVAEGDMPFG